jgi:GH15 family glucan-1,4-alpha-glucosidase
VALAIEDYALIGDCESAALVGRDGSIDWWCAPRFDSPACFAGLLGTPDHGRWLLAPAGRLVSSTRRYRGETLVLETELEGEGGAVAVIDFLPLGDQGTSLVRVVEGRRGRVAMRMDLRIRFDYGSIIPWVRRQEGDGLLAVGGPDSLRLRTPVETRGEGFSTVADFEVSAGQRVPFELTWYPSHQAPPPPLDLAKAQADTEAWWTAWSARSTHPARVPGPGDPHNGQWRDAVTRSLIVLKALTYGPTGGIVAAPTTSLPERIGGVRNWDYRFCWLRDATFTLFALMESGYRDEARAFREWLLRAAAGAPDQLRLMYGITGKRRLPELELTWLPGYEGSLPVRVGNAASGQRQHDVFGELMDAMYNCWRAELGPAPHAWALERAVVEYLETIWREPDAGIWEVRGPYRHFTHSKMMAWVAIDRAIKTVEQCAFQVPAGTLERWRAVRAEIHAEVCARGYSPARGAFVQDYGSDRLDASLLMMPLVGFLPVTDPRVRGTVQAIERDLLVDGFVRRYVPEPAVDGLPPGEGAFLLCTFWLVDNLALLGRYADAERLFEGVLAIRNDVGLLAECYDVPLRRQVGNFPQAFSHVGLVNSARNLSHRPGGPAKDRPGDAG